MTGAQREGAGTVGSGSVLQVPCPVRAVSVGPDPHFYGYYLTTPWDAGDRRLLAHRGPDVRRPPLPEDVAEIGVMEGEERWRAVARTGTWNWQQGSMLQWLDEERIIFNDRDGDRAVAAVVDLASGERNTLPRPVYSVAPRGDSALTLDFGRLQRMRPVCGYPGITDPYASQSAPDRDGVHRMDLATGRSHLVLSLAEMAAAHPEPSMEGAHHWFNHLLLDPSGTRFACLHRWRRPDGAERYDRLFVADLDGGGVQWIGDEGYASHFGWRDPTTLLVFMQHGGRMGYFLADVRDGSLAPIGEDVLDRNGHCTYSPDRAWILTDTYPDPATAERTLLLYHPASGVRVDVGRFYSDPELTGELRCDLHPRWNHAGDAVCIDSVHEGSRQMYVVDVAAVVGHPRFARPEDGS